VFQIKPDNRRQQSGDQERNIAFEREFKIIRIKQVLLIFDNAASTHSNKQAKSNAPIACCQTAAQNNVVN